MNSNSTTRRDFLAKTAKVAVAGCILSACPKLGIASMLREGDIPDPKNLNYCGYSCPDDCKMLLATLKNDTLLKKEVYKEWRFEEKYGLAFDPDQIVCYGCKVEGAERSYVVKSCSVRNCAIEKSFDCCIECDELASCEKEIWANFPNFHKSILEMQKIYLAG